MVMRTLLKWTDDDNDDSVDFMKTVLDNRQTELFTLLIVCEWQV